MKKGNNLTIWVLIPAFNEAKHIGPLLDNLKQLPVKILVVDDGSVDHTFEIAKRKADFVLRNEKNMGKGLSLRRGILFLLSTKQFDYLAIMDADNQHCPNDLAYFIDYAKEHNVDFIIGNRMNNPSNMPLLRKLTNKLMSLLISYIAGQRIPDTQCGFRLIKREVLKQIHIETEKFEIESEIIIKAAKNKIKITSLPIKSIYFSNHNSKINPIIDTLRFLRFIFTHKQNKQKNEDKYLLMRIAMVENQIVKRGISNPKIIEAMKAIPRHEFVPEKVKHLAYEDSPLPIGYDQTISQPYIVAFMLDKLAIKPGQKVLEIGTGSGYQTAILAYLQAKIYTVERIPQLLQQAEKNLAKFNFEINFKLGDGNLGWQEFAPYNKIIISAAVKKIPDDLIEQLAENGKIIAPVGKAYFQKLVLGTKKNGKLNYEELLPGCVFVPLIGENKPE